MSNIYFYSDPLYYKPHNAEKDDYLKRSSVFLQELFALDQSSIRQLSINYKTNPDGLRNFLFIVQSWNRITKYELKEKATTMALCSAIFTIEGLNRHIGLTKRERNHKKSIGEKRVFNYLKNFLPENDKIILLNSIIFSQDAKHIPMGHVTERHFMYRNMLKKEGKEYYKQKYCSPVEDTENIHCHCINFLKTTAGLKFLNYYLRKLTHHLYKMRCAVVHDGIAPIFCHAEEKPADYASWSMTVCDMYGDLKEKKYFRYDSALSRKKFEEIFKNTLLEAYKTGLPKK